MTEFFLEKGIDQLVAEFIESNSPSVRDISVEERREGYLASTALAGPNRTLERVYELDADGICLRIYQPSNENHLPVVIYFHGGCFVSGSFETHEQQLREIAHQSRSVVVAVDYRLAPEFPFPAAHDDAFRATKYVYQNCQRLGGDNNKIVLAGDSAGGHLALITSFRLKEQEDWLPKKQILIYPMLDATASCQSYQDNGDNFIITKETLLSGFDMYLGDSGVSKRHPEISPLFRTDLAGLPETHILTAEYDPLLDEGETFYKQLVKAGVPAQCQRYFGVTHGFYQLSGISQAARTSISHVSAIVRELVD